MPSPRSLFARILPSVLALFIGCSAGLAQIHEEKPMPGLEEGILVHFEKDGKGAIPAAGNAIGTGDFSVACHLALPQGPQLFEGTIGIATGSEEVARHDHKGAAWKLLLGSDGALSFVAWPEAGAETLKIDTPKGAVIWGRSHDIVVSVHRDARQPLSGIWVDGIEIASGTFAPVDLRASLPGGAWDLSEWIKSVTVYNRALSRPEILDLAMCASANGGPGPSHPAIPPDGPRFVPQPDETIALLGGTEAVALAESGELEALMLMAFPQTRFHFRSLAWEGDTVFRQDRPMNFGSMEQQLRRVNAGAVFVMFGRQECLENEKAESGTMKVEDLVEFKAAFGRLLGTVSKVTPNIVIIGPEFFEPLGARAQALLRINDSLHAFLDASAEAASRHNALFVDPRHVITDPPKSLTQDGVNYNAHGLAFWAGAIALGLNLPHSANDSGPPAQLIHLICAKNSLWHDCWRPSNWAFLHGDRTNQPSSRDPVNPQIRFFPSEQEKYLPLIKEAEDKVFQLVQEAQKKLP